MGDELVHLQTTLLPVLDQARQLCPTLDTTKSTALPLTTGHELEWSCRDFCVNVSRRIYPLSAASSYLLPRGRRQ
jgi:hypothetical protein